MKLNFKITEAIDPNLKVVNDAEYQDPTIINPELQDIENDNGEFVSLNDEEHNVNCSCNAILLPTLINLLAILKHHCDNGVAKKVCICGCECGNDDLHDDDGNHNMFIGGNEFDDSNNNDMMNGIIVNDQPYGDWIEEQCKKVKLIA